MGAVSAGQGRGEWAGRGGTVVFMIGFPVRMRGADLRQGPRGLRRGCALIEDVAGREGIEGGGLGAQAVVA